MPTPVIEIQGLSKTYRIGDVSVDALRSVDLSIGTSDFLAIMGASGSGKSTLMNILGCLDRPTEGSYRLDGHDVGSLDRDALARIRGKKIGFVFQGFNLLSRMTAIENVELPMLYDQVPTHQRRERAIEALRSVGLADRSHHLPSQMSGGQQQRVAIARAIVNNPSLLLADEPTGNLDTSTSEEVMGIVQRLNDERGITIVLVTHETDISEFARRVVTVRDGKIVSDHPIEHRRIAASPGPAS
ncbi:MAG TPA: ABC transporter ATP-binding protein [Candidatus Deferrimicrobiaceae bacterium]|jgi:putative ABC transport system ATP-binding protein